MPIKRSLKNQPEPDLKVGRIVVSKVFFAKRTHLENCRKANNGWVKSGFWHAKTIVKTKPNEPIHRKAS
jgi:hypothetical protein